MKKTPYFLFLFLNFIYSQNSLSDLLKEYNSESIPYIYVDSLANIQKNIVILDAREKKEYEVSHIKDAIFIGYDNFNLKKTTSQLKDKNSTIVVYCSLGIRSEDIAIKLSKKGYKNVYNLYGGIFEWKNKDFPVMDLKEEETNKVHTFSKEWSKWLNKGEKIYE